MQQLLADINDELAGGARLRIIEHFLTAEESEFLLEKLMTDINWRQDTLRLFGKAHRLPRLHQWFGDPDTTYRWSGLTLQPEPWTADLQALRIRIEQTTQTSFNSVLANWYRDGNDSMGWHADDEPELGRQPVIASLSVGAERDLLLRYRDKSAKVPNLKLRLSNGSLLVMSGATQLSWQHSLPKRKKVSAPRINLTFRRIF